MTLTTIDTRESVGGPGRGDDDGQDGREEQRDVDPPLVLLEALAGFGGPGVVEDAVVVPR